MLLSLPDQMQYCVVSERDYVEACVQNHKMASYAMDSSSSDFLINSYLCPPTESIPLFRESIKQRTWNGLSEICMYPNYYKELQNHTQLLYHKLYVIYTSDNEHILIIKQHLTSS